MSAVELCISNGNGGEVRFPDAATLAGFAARASDQVSNQLELLVKLIHDPDGRGADLVQLQIAFEAVTGQAYQVAQAAGLLKHLVERMAEVAHG